MKNFLLFLILLAITNTFGQNKMYIWKNNVITDSMAITDDLKISFKSGGFACGTSTVDYSGKIYHTVLIGSQCWLKENLDVGTRINGTLSASNNGVIEKYCYNDLDANCDTSGGLYEWNEAMKYVNIQGAQGICPPGWHIPRKAEFDTLRSIVNNSSNSLKAMGQGTGSGMGTNTSGFSALLGGYRNTSYVFVQFGNYAAFWSSLVNTTPYNMEIYGNNNTIDINNDHGLNDGFSVRCIKD